MALNTNISWTDHTWNIARGCSKVDEDCKYCYMYRDSFDGTRYEPKTVTRTKGVFTAPLKIKEPSKIFTSSLTDVFHVDVDPFRAEMWAIMRRCPQHTFQVLTKRPERISFNMPDFWRDLIPHVWLGTSIGSQASIRRVFDLMTAPDEFLKFLSLEPLHGRVDLPLDAIVRGKPLRERLGWVIVGGESGNETGKYQYRPCELEWIQHLVDQCQAAGIPVFVKQMGTYLSKRFSLSDRHGTDINDFPPALQIRQFPV